MSRIESSKIRLETRQNVIHLYEFCALGGMHSVKLHSNMRHHFKRNRHFSKMKNIRELPLSMSKCGITGEGAG